MCGCFAEFGFDSQQECLADVMDEPDEYDMCVKDVHDNSTEDDANQQCILAAVRQMNTCLGQLTCEDFEGYYDSGFYDCYLQYYEAIQDCPPLPESFEMMLEECWDSSSTFGTSATTTAGDQGGQFDCEDGSGSIPTEWVCDGDEDCDDGSDELDCSSTPDDGEKRSRRPKAVLYGAR